MSKVLEVDLPDDLYDELLRRAHRAGTTPARVVEESVRAGLLSAVGTQDDAIRRLTEDGLYEPAASRVPPTPAADRFVTKPPIGEPVSDTIIRERR